MSVRPYQNISRAHCLEVILRNAKKAITTIVRGHNGWGKTALCKDLQKALPKHTLIVCDMSTKEAGDMAMPRFTVDNGKDVVAAVPHKDLGLHLDRPVILFIDEIFKTKKPLQVAMAQLLYEHRMGDVQLHPDSVVCGASNLEDEGFGDQSLGFVYNRISLVEMRKPTHEEWADDYALAANIHPTIIQSAKEYPSMFADYRDYKKPDDNQYIFHPQSGRSFYVTGRSLERASNLLYTLEGLPSEVITHALANCVGERAAMDIMAVNELHAELPAWTDILKDPKKTKLPKSAGAACMLVYTAIQHMDEKAIQPWMTYVQRMQKEVQALFASSILRVESKSQIVSTEKSFLDWAMANQYLYKTS